MCLTTEFLFPLSIYYWIVTLVVLPTGLRHHADQVPTGIIWLQMCPFTSPGIPWAPWIQASALLISILFVSFQLK